MEDALWAQLQNTSLEDTDKRHESETDSDDDDDESSIHHETGPDLSSRTNGPQTGPKGVRADRDYYEHQQRQAQGEQRRQHNERMLKKAATTTTYLQDQQELVLEHLEEEDSSDEEMLKEYRRKRIQELKNMSNNRAIRKQQKVFGKVATVEADDYVDAIDDEWKSVPVIVHLYDNSLPMCRLLDDIFVGLATKYALAKFIRVSALDLEFDLVGSPSILAYQNGVLVANLVRIIDEVGSRFDGESIEDILLKHGALSENDLYDDIPRLSDQED